MNSEIKILFIDDGDVTNVAEGVIRKLKRATPTSYNATWDFMNMGDSSLKKMDSDGTFCLDEEKVKSCLTEKMNTRYDVVACDFNYNNDKAVNGYHVLNYLIKTSNNSSPKLPIRKAAFVFYTSEEDKTMEALFKSHELSKLINLKISHFEKREELVNNLPSFIIKMKAPLNLSDHLIEKLQLHHDLSFRNTYPKLKDKSLLQIAHEIDVESHHGIEFAKYVVDMAMDNILEMNK